MTRIDKSAEDLYWIRDKGKGGIGNTKFLWDLACYGRRGIWQVLFWEYPRSGIFSSQKVHLSGALWNMPERTFCKWNCNYWKCWWHQFVSWWAEHNSLLCRVHCSPTPKTLWECVFLPKHLIKSKPNKKLFLRSVQDRVIENEDIQFYWTLLSQDIENPDDSVAALCDAEQLWVTIRRYSMVGSWMEA